MPQRRQPQTGMMYWVMMEVGVVEVGVEVMVEEMEVVMEVVVVGKKIDNFWYGSGAPRDAQGSGHDTGGSKQLSSLTSRATDEVLLEIVLLLLLLLL